MIQSWSVPALGCVRTAYGRRKYRRYECLLPEAPVLPAFFFLLLFRLVSQKESAVRQYGSDHGRAMKDRILSMAQLTLPFSNYPYPIFFALQDRQVLLDHVYSLVNSSR